MSPESNYLTERTKYGQETKREPKKLGLEKFVLTTIGIGLIAHLAYDFTRPSVRGEILGGDFSNQKTSQIYLINDKTESIDTLLLNTITKKNEVSFTLGNPEDYISKASELKEKLTPGTIASFKLYKNNEVYKINN